MELAPALTPLACSPLVNMILGGLDATVNVFGLTIPLNTYNRVGVLLAAFDCVAFVLIYLFLLEPKNSNKDAAAAAAKSIQNDEPKQEHEGWKVVFQELASIIKLLLSIFANFVIMANYNLIETTFSPAASHGLGWVPVQISAVYSISSICMLICTIITMVLSKSYKIRDTIFILVEFTFWTVARLMMVCKEAQSVAYELGLFVLTIATMGSLFSCKLVISLVIYHNKTHQRSVSSWLLCFLVNCIDQ